MSNKKQTAVDILKSAIELIRSQAYEKHHANEHRPLSEASIEAAACIDVCEHLLLVHIPQAKELEKQQHEDTFNKSRAITEGGDCAVWNCEGNIKEHETFDQYFKDTYGE